MGFITRSMTAHFCGNSSGAKCFTTESLTLNTAPIACDIITYICSIVMLVLLKVVSKRWSCSLIYYRTGVTWVFSDEDTHVKYSSKWTSVWPQHKLDILQRSPTHIKSFPQEKHHITCDEIVIDNTIVQNDIFRNWNGKKKTPIQPGIWTCKIERCICCLSCYRKVATKRPTYHIKSSSKWMSAWQWNIIMTFCTGRVPMLFPREKHYMV